MHRPTLVLGGLLIALMFVIPPFETGPVDDVADALGGDTVASIEYHPLWARPSLQSDGPLSSVQNWTIAWTRLLLQLLVVVLMTGGIAYTLDS